MAVRHTPTHKKASRKTISCENCRARKVRCSRESPCQHCTKRGEECVWKADAHPMVRETKGHSYTETDSTTLHKTIDILGSRLTLSSEDLDELIRSLAPSGSSSHSEEEGTSDTAGSPISHSPVGYPSMSPRTDPKSLTPSSSSSMPFLPPLPPTALNGNWSQQSSRQPSFTMPVARPPAVSYGTPSDGWPQQMSMHEQMMSFGFSPASQQQPQQGSSSNNNLVLPQATTPSAFPPTMNGFFDPLPLGSMHSMGGPSVQAQPQSIPSRGEQSDSASYNNWLTTALGSSLGAGYPLPASNISSTSVLAY